MKLFTHKNEKIQSSFQRRFTETINSFEGKNLTEIDKKLLRGLNSKRLEDSEVNKDKMIAGIKEYILKRVDSKKSEMLEQDEIYSA